MSFFLAWKSDPSAVRPRHGGRLWMTAAKMPGLTVAQGLNCVMKPGYILTQSLAETGNFIINLDVLYEVGSESSNQQSEGE
jgi:hypothetical protein